MTRDEALTEIIRLLFDSKWDARRTPDVIVARVRELVAAQPQPAVPSRLPAEPASGGFHVWQNQKQIAIPLYQPDVQHSDYVWAVVDKDLFSCSIARLCKSNVSLDGWVECQIVAPPIKEPEPIPPKPAKRVIVLARRRDSTNASWQWWTRLYSRWCDGFGLDEQPNMLEPHTDCDDPEHLAGLELLKRQQGGE